MENIIISIADKEEADFLIELVKKLGFNPLIISDEKKRLIARKKLLKISDKVEKSEVNEAEVKYEVDKVRRKRYAKKK